MHNTAVRRLGEIRKEPASSSGNNLNSSSSASCSGIPKQATILTHMQKLSTRHQSQLTKKLQSAHFIITGMRKNWANLFILEHVVYILCTILWNMVKKHLGGM